VEGSAVRPAASQILPEKRPEGTTHIRDSARIFRSIDSRLGCDRSYLVVILALLGLGPTQGDEKPLLFSNNSLRRRHPSLCHLDRSEAQWRDLCVDAPSWECFSTEAQRSGGTCGFCPGIDFGEVLYSEMGSNPLARRRVLGKNPASNPIAGSQAQIL
jgi:hypothetical protein